MKHHQLVKSLIQQHLPNHIEETELNAFLSALNHNFMLSDNEQKQLQHSIQSTSTELITRNKTLEYQLNELKQTQKALEESHSLLHACLVSSYEALLVLDLEGKVRLYNPNFSSMFGVDSDENQLNTIDEYLSIVKAMTLTPKKFIKGFLDTFATPETKSRHELKTNQGRTIEACSCPQLLGSKIVGQVWSFRDLTELKLKEEEARYRAYHDLLTGLPNRRLLSTRLNQALSNLTNRNKTALLFIDLDGFKDVNDSLGHSVGDALLKEITHRIEKDMPPNTVLYRHGGDEFIAVMEVQTEQQSSANFAQQIVDSFVTPFHIGNEEIYMSASIGIALAPEHGNSSDKLISNADIAMYQAKKRGKNAYIFYQNKLNEQAPHRLKIRNQLNIALEQNQFELFFQPKISLESGTIKGAEALIRWSSADGQYRSPVEFIPIAEENGQIIPISQWVIKRCCQYLKDWQNDLDDDFVLALNISARHFQKGLLQQDMAKFISEVGIDPSKLELEVTETAIMDDIDLAVQTLTELKNMGIRTAIDDFGTGHSSLSYLRKLPIEILKIDKSFIDEILISQEDQTLVRGIINMVHALGIEVVAEGVENHSMATLLHEMDCDLVQGFHYCRPVPEHEFIALIRNRQCYI
jgi:diguanylate cyclase (GGDEF)-like protein